MPFLPRTSRSQARFTHSPVPAGEVRRGMNLLGPVVVPEDGPGAEQLDLNAFSEMQAGWDEVAGDRGCKQNHVTAGTGDAGHLAQHGTQPVVYVALDVVLVPEGQVRHAGVDGARGRVERARVTHSDGCGRNVAGRGIDRAGVDVDAVHFRPAGPHRFGEDGA